MKYNYNGKEYPELRQEQRFDINGSPDNDEIFRTICEDINGDFILLEFNTSAQIKIVDFLSQDDVQAIK